MTSERDTHLSRMLGKNLVKLRKTRYASTGGQGHAAKEFGVTQPEWSKWERGERLPSDTNQRKLAEFFGVSLAELRGDHSTAPSPEPAPTMDPIAALVAQIDAIRKERDEAGRERDEVRKELDHWKERAIRAETLLEEREKKGSPATPTTEPSTPVKEDSPPIRKTRGA